MIVCVICLNVQGCDCSGIRKNSDFLVKGGKSNSWLLKIIPRSTNIGIFMSFFSFYKVKNMNVPNALMFKICKGRDHMKFTTITFSITVRFLPWVSPDCRILTLWVGRVGLGQYCIWWPRSETQESTILHIAHAHKLFPPCLLRPCKNVLTLNQHNNTQQFSSSVVSVSAEQIKLLPVTVCQFVRVCQGQQGPADDTKNWLILHN